MEQLATWLKQNMQVLVESASEKLAQDARIRATVEESVASFYDSVARSAKLGNALPLHAQLIDWVEARSAPTDEAFDGGLVPVLTTLKRVLWESVCEHAESEKAVPMLSQIEELFSEAAGQLAQLETEALLKDTDNELLRMRTEMQRIEKRKTDFIAVAAHELKTPLTIIEGYNGMIKSLIGSLGRPDLASVVEGLASGTARLRELIQDMIDVSLIDMQMLELHYQPLWLNRLMEIVEEEIERDVKQRGLTLSIKHETLPRSPTYGDPERLLQVLMKVIANAIKYTPDGGAVTISARELPGFTDLMVEDTGIGIAAEDLSIIFQKFSSMEDVSTHSSGKVKFKGAGPGLGLAIARGIIEAHGGSIWAESEGHSETALPGSTFHILIPMRDAPPEDEMGAEVFRTVTQGQGEWA